MVQHGESESGREGENSSDLFQEAPIGYLLLDGDGLITMVNRVGTRIFRRPAAELVGHPFSAFCPDNPLARVRALIVGWHWPSREPLHREEIQIRLPDGEPRWVRVTVDPVYDFAGRVTSTRMLVEDMFEEMVGATDLRLASVRFRVAFQNAPVGMHLSTSEGRFLEVNGALCQMLGYSEAQLLTMQVWDVVHPDDLDAFAPARAALFAGERFEVDSRFVTSDGSIRWCRLAAMLPGGPEGYLVSQVTDISDLVDLHRQLEGMLREKDRFIATVSHELRTPLTGVLGFASELRDGLSGFTSAEVIEFAGLIARGCAVANNLVEDLLVAAKLDTGDLDLKPEPTDLYAEALSLLAEPETSSRTEGKSITVEGEPSIAWADPHRVHQIMRNLVGNADRYGGGHIGIVVGRESESSTAFLRVVDDGPGVPDELGDLLFQPYQHSPQNADPHESMGLGLYISRRLARLMEGELSYRRQDDTTIFELVLPLYREGMAPVE